jgi:hypothetical protein
MNLTKSKVISTITIFALCFVFHFVYDVMPSPITAIFFPVNESIWEHMKIIYTSYLIYSMIDYFWLKKDNKFNNFLLQLFLVPLIGIILYLIIYIPLYNMFKENMVISILLLFLIIVAEQLISYYILNKKISITKLQSLHIVTDSKPLVNCKCYLMTGIKKNAGTVFIKQVPASASRPRLRP